MVGAGFAGVKATADSGSGAQYCQPFGVLPWFSDLVGCVEAAVGPIEPGLDPVHPQGRTPPGGQFSMSPNRAHIWDSRSRCAGTREVVGRARWRRVIGGDTTSREASGAMSAGGRSRLGLEIRVGDRLCHQRRPRSASRQLASNWTAKVVGRREEPQSRPHDGEEPEFSAGEAEEAGLAVYRGFGEQPSAVRHGGARGSGFPLNGW